MQIIYATSLQRCFGLLLILSFTRPRAVAWSTIRFFEWIERRDWIREAKRNIKYLFD